MKTYKLQLTLIVEMNDETAEYYRDSIPDMHEALVTCDKAKLVMEETQEPPQEKW